VAKEGVIDSQPDRQSRHGDAFSRFGILRTAGGGLAFILALTHCGGGTPPVPVVLSSMAISPSAPNLVVGTTQQFTATGLYSDGSTHNLSASASWSSSNSQVATVSSTGLATVKQGGAVTITATAGSTSASTAPLNVLSVSISVTPSSAHLSIGQSQQFTATVANASNTAVTWSVDGTVGGNSTVGTISSSGLYQTPVGPGSHTIVATSQADPTMSASVTLTVSYAGMFTYHNDLGRTGQNLNEVTLRPSNVNFAQFGKLFSYPVDGAIYAQPLYARSVTIPGQGVHNAVYVVTQHDSVYAFDADGKSSSPLWKVSFANPADGITSVAATSVSDDAFPGGEIGITSTPVIDPTTGTLYVVAYTAENGQFVYRLHALDLTTGKEKLGGPVLLQATVAGAGDGNNGQGELPFDPKMHLQRPGLLLVKGIIYIAFGSHADNPPWHGWLLAYDATSLQQLAASNVTPNEGGGAIWESGDAPAADANGDVYVTTGNGYPVPGGGFDAGSGGSDYGDSVLKLQPGNLKVLDWFKPNNPLLDSEDDDLGSGGVLLLPDQPGPHPQLLVVAGKLPSIYLIDRNNLGRFNLVADQIVQRVDNQLGDNQLGSIFSTPSYWQGNIYFAAWDDTLKMFTLESGLLSSFPVAQSSNTFGYVGATTSISANVMTNSIVWAVDWSGFASGSPAVLYAYDATDVSHELYSTSQAGSRDALGAAAKFSVPTVINGKVYVGAATELDVLGLLDP
jgi:Bacterial Ig-like domain (group 2)